jgi:hypothetical protein
MKKFKKIKTIKSFEGSKLTREQIHVTTGGILQNQTKYTRAENHVDGIDDSP